jgi:hypothetical protein
MHYPLKLTSNGGGTLALLDRLFHHVKIIVIEGRSNRSKDQINPP